MSQQLHGEQLPKLPDELNEVLAARTFTTDHSSVLCSEWREDIFQPVGAFLPSEHRPHVSNRFAYLTKLN